MMFREIFDATILDECLEDNLPETFPFWELVTPHTLNSTSCGARPRGPSALSEYIGIMG